MAGESYPGVSHAPPGSVTEKLMAILHSQFPGLTLISGYRPGAVTVTGKTSMHASAKAADLPPRMDVFNWIHDNYGAQTFELIFTPAGKRQIYKGQPHTYTGAVAATHLTHVHWSVAALGDLSNPSGGSGGGGGDTPVSLPLTGTPTDPVSDALGLEPIKKFFSEQHGLRRSIMISVGVGLVLIGISATFVKQAVAKAGEILA